MGGSGFRVAGASLGSFQHNGLVWVEKTRHLTESLGLQHGMVIDHVGRFGYTVLPFKPINPKPYTLNPDPLPGPLF